MVFVLSFIGSITGFNNFHGNIRATIFNADALTLYIKYLVEWLDLSGRLIFGSRLADSHDLALVSIAIHHYSAHTDLRAGAPNGGAWTAGPLASMSAMNSAETE